MCQTSQRHCYMIEQVLIYNTSWNLIWNRLFVTNLTPFKSEFKDAGKYIDRKILREKQRKW